MSSPIKLVVAIPSYRCEKQVSRVLEGFDSELLTRVDKILVVDNRSPDATIKAALETIQRLSLKKAEVVRNDQNFGLGGSHKMIFQYAEKHGFTHVAILHGDAQGKTTELKELISQAEIHSDCAAILGARFMSGSKLQGYSSLRTWGNRVLNLVYTLLSGRSTYDLGSGLNIFRIQELKSKRYLKFSDAFTFNMDLLLDYYKQHAKVKFVPITWSETDQVSNARTFRVGWSALTTLLRWRFGLQTSLQGFPTYTSTSVTEL